MTQGDTIYLLSDDDKLQRVPRHQRPPWDGVGEWTRLGVARFRFVRTRAEWQLYWMRRDLRWHRTTLTLPLAIWPRS